MARKSSFLQGFEVGQDLYSRGVAQAQSSAQMQMRKRQMQLSEAAQAQRGELLDLQTRESKYRMDRNKLLDDRMESDRKTAEKAFAEATSLMGGSDTRNNDDDFEMHQRVWEGFLPDVMKNKAVYDRYQMLNGITKQGMASKRKEEADDQAFKNSNRDARAASKQRDADATTVAAFNSQFKTHFGSKDLSEVREWTIRANKLGAGMASGRYNQESPEYQELVAEFPGNADVLQEQLLTKGQDYEIAIAEQKRKVDATRAGLVFKDKLDSSSALALELAKKSFASGKYNPDQFKALSDNWVKLRADKTVATAGAAQAQFSQIEELFQSRGAKNFTAADDLAFVFLFMKSLDPQSVVREGEFANAQNATGVPARIRNKWNEMLEGNRLNPQQRGEFYDTAKSSVTGMRRSALKVVNSYSAQMTELGLPDERFQAVRDMIGAVPGRQYTFKTEAEAMAAGARGEFEYGDSVIYTEADGVTTAMTTWRPPPESQPQTQESQPQTQEPTPLASQHDASNPDAYKTNKTFQEHFGQLDDAGQRARWREVYKEYTLGGVLPAAEMLDPSITEPAPVEAAVDKPEVHVPGEGMVDEDSPAVDNQDPLVGLVGPAINSDHPSWSSINWENPTSMLVNGNPAILHGNQKDGFGLRISGDGGVYLMTLDQVNKAMEMGLLKLGDK